MLRSRRHSCLVESKTHSITKKVPTPIKIIITISSDPTPRKNCVDQFQAILSSKKKPQKVHRNVPDTQTFSTLSTKKTPGTPISSQNSSKRSSKKPPLTHIPRTTTINQNSAISVRTCTGIVNCTVYKNSMKRGRRITNIKKK